MRLQHTLLAAIGCLSIGGTSLATLLDGRVNKSGDTMTGNLTLTAGNFSVNTGKVGVGTTTPATALHLRSNWPGCWCAMP